MSTPGALALVGGGEHRPPCRTTDRWLLETTGASVPRVVVVPAASPRVTQPSTAALARTWWHGLGAATTVAVPGRQPTAQIVDAIAAADLVVLPGGVPERLLATVGASPVGEAILERWRAGASLSGSSAGAMVLFAWRLRIASTRPLGLTPGLGALDGYVAVPHFDRFIGTRPSGRRFAERHRRRLRGLGVLGIDESTALVCHEGSSRVLGAGAVTVGDDRGWSISRTGATVDLRVDPVARTAGPRTTGPSREPEPRPLRSAAA